jgi:lysozyme family protein
VKEEPKNDVFDKAFEYTIGNEGGYSNIPEDKGGPTNWGIIQEELARWRDHPVSANDVRLLTQSEAKRIYKAWYWDKLNLDKIQNEKVAMAIFDRAILNGLTGVSRYVRTIFNDTSNDGPNFNNLIELINLYNSRKFVIKLSDLCEKAHRERVEKDPTQERFLKGWLNRVNRMRVELT